MSTSEIHPLLPTLSATVFIEIDKVIDKEKFIDYSVRLNYIRFMNILEELFRS